MLVKVAPYYIAGCTWMLKISLSFKSNCFVGYLFDVSLYNPYMLCVLLCPIIDEDVRNMNFSIVIRTFYFHSFASQLL